MDVLAGTHAAGSHDATDHVTLQRVTLQRVTLQGHMMRLIMDGARECTLTKEWLQTLLGRCLTTPRVCLKSRPRPVKGGCISSIVSS